jgi:hypothetical protein
MSLLAALPHAPRNAANFRLVRVNFVNFAGAVR